VFVVCWTLTTHGKYSVAGDEPHYLMVCQSLRADGDLDLRNNYAQNDGEKFGAAGVLPEQHIRPNRDGRFFPVHDIGLPVALLPVYSAATAVSNVTSASVLKRFRMTRGLFAYSLMSIVMIGVVAAAAALTRSALLANGTEAAMASAITIAAWLSPPVLSNSFVIFPEIPALLATAAALHFAFVDERPSRRARVFALALFFGLLPWFHRKFVVYAALLAIAVLRERRGWWAAMTLGDRAFAASLFAAPQAALAVWTWHYWGNLAGPLALAGSLFSREAFVHGFAGLLLDRESGLLAWAPIYSIAAAACILAGRRYLPWMAAGASLYLLSAAHLQWWGGFSPAARFLMPVVPILCLVGSGAVKHRPFRNAALILLVLQVLVSADGWQHTRDLWPQGNGRNAVLERLLSWIGASDRILPSLRTAPTATLVLLWAGVLVAINSVVLIRSRRIQNQI
jgi:hypothetical protein